MTHDKLKEGHAEHFISLDEKLILFGMVVGLVYFRVDSRSNWYDNLGGVLAVQLSCWQEFIVLSLVLIN